MCLPETDWDAMLHDRYEAETGERYEDCPEDCDCPPCVYQRAENAAECGYEERHDDEHVRACAVCAGDRLADEIEHAEHERDWREGR